MGASGEVFFEKPRNFWRETPTKKIWWETFCWLVLRRFDGKNFSGEDLRRKTSPEKIRRKTSTEKTSSTSPKLLQLDIFSVREKLIQLLRNKTSVKKKTSPKKNLDKENLILSSRPKFLRKNFWRALYNYYNFKIDFPVKKHAFITAVDSRYTSFFLDFWRFGFVKSKNIHFWSDFFL